MTFPINPMNVLAELADTLALGASGRKAVQVQVLFRAPLGFLLLPLMAATGA